MTKAIPVLIALKMLCLPSIGDDFVHYDFDSADIVAPGSVFDVVLGITATCNVPDTGTTMVRDSNKTVTNDYLESLFGQMTFIWPRWRLNPVGTGYVHLNISPVGLGVYLFLSDIDYNESVTLLDGLSQGLAQDRFLGTVPLDGVSGPSESYNGITYIAETGVIRDINGGSNSDPISIFDITGINDVYLAFSSNSTQFCVAISDEVVLRSCEDVIADGLLLPGDISGPNGQPDCYVDIYDLIQMASDWLNFSN